jgi:hypothetical protein
MTDEQQLLNLSLSSKIDKEGYISIRVQAAGEDQPQNVRVRPDQVMSIIDGIIDRVQHISLPDGYVLKHDLIKKRAEIAKLVSQAETDAMLQATAARRWR